MKFKKITAITLAVAVVFGVLTAPTAQMQTEAASSLVYTDNRAGGISSVSIQTPQDAVRLYAELSWEALKGDIGVRLVVSETGRGPMAKSVLDRAAASLGATEVKTIDMRLEKYLGNSGWTQAIEETAERIRVCIALPVGSDPSKDYAVISLKKDGAYEVLGDLDATPATITVDTNYFNTYMIVAAPAGTFNPYRVINPKALDKLEIPHFVKKIPSAIETRIKRSNEIIYDMGIITDTATTWSIVGGSNASLTLKETRPGKDAVAAMENAVKNTKAEREKIKEDGKVKDKALTYYDIALGNHKGETVIRTNGKLRITMTVPFSAPAYADYAMAVLNENGSVSILKDIDADAGTITFDTDQFRLFVFLWGKKGAFDNIK